MNPSPGPAHHARISIGHASVLDKLVRASAPSWLRYCRSSSTVKVAISLVRKPLGQMTTVKAGREREQGRAYMRGEVSHFNTHLVVVESKFQKP